MTIMAHRVQSFGTTIFAEMTDLALRHNAINLGQGFPDFPAPQFVKEAATRAIAADINQYAPSTGRPRLRRAIAAHLHRRYRLEVDPEREIVVTDGATEALFAAVQALVNPGDEVVIFEPYYDAYVPDVQMAGGVPRFYPLRPPDWRIDPERLAALFNERTRLLILNTPQNPIGKVYDEGELALIARLCREHDVVALSDEVYEQITFDGVRHVPLATLPGMRERTITVSSAGKTFSVTGWKIGWAVAPAPLAQAIYRAHQFITFSGAAPLQEAIAVALETAEERGYYDELRATYEQKRDFLGEALEAAGLTPLWPQGTYFIMADISRLGFPDDVAFCRYLAAEVGVAAIPPSAFYTTPGGGSTVARFAFCKTDTALEEAARRLQQLGRG
ncbi:MAG: methionine aminotransferase [Candidatus Promineifilaceae bacterium]|nr:methionine aminotransferase [Candidatus Promineifilaceae bacterium]